MSLIETYEKTLVQRKQNHHYRQCHPVSWVNRPVIERDGQRVVDFSSSDYLGFAQDPTLKQAAIEAIKNNGCGTTSARLIGGTYSVHLALEEAIAHFKQTEAALLFNSGYQANVGVLSALIPRDGVIFADKLNHASLVDGAILSRAKVVRYPHLDIETLKKRMDATPRNKAKFIVTDTVFSMDGDIAPVQALFELAESYDALLILDEAHATGLFGETHRSGVWETTGLGPQDRVVQIGTFSKALGSFGAYVAAKKVIIETLIQSSRSFVYSTALPPSVVAANLAAIDRLQSDPQPTQQVWTNVEIFLKLAQSHQIPVHSASPIMPIIFKDSLSVVTVAARLLEAGYFVQAIRPPTVPEGTARLRITINATHTPAQIQSLLEALYQVYSR